MLWACLDDFSVRDIRDPQAPRIRRIYSALLNFYLFEQDQMPRLAALEEQAEEIAKSEHEEARKHVELQTAIERKRLASTVYGLFRSYTMSRQSGISESSWPSRRTRERERSHAGRAAAETWHRYGSSQ